MSNVNLAEKRHIVIIDDDSDIQDIVAAYFRPRGYQVTSFADAESALQKLVTEGHSWDVLITDLHLPQMSGVELTLQVKKTLPHLPIILITTTKSAETAVEAIQKGAYDFIVKPIHFPQLQISIERALHLKKLKGDLTELRERVKFTKTPSNMGIVGKSPRFLAALDIAKRVANSSANIFVSGESGTGKEVIARYIHAESKRKKGPFVAINCSAIPENLLESELFGHARGAFTGAQDKKIGLFEDAQDGTLFLDEIGDLSLALQAKLLRVLQEKKIKRLGENQYRPINCRIISATHKNLPAEVAEQRFREDLFFRLNVIPIHIPALRERSEDLLPLAEAFLKRFAMENDSPAKSFSKEAIKFIMDQPWRGNVRELENCVERSVVLASGAEITLNDLMPTAMTLNSAAVNAGSAASNPAHEKVFQIWHDDHLPKLEEVVNKYIEYAVDLNGGARDKTAKELGIDRKTLYKRLKHDNLGNEVSAH